MKSEMFGRRLKKRNENQRVPGAGLNSSTMPPMETAKDNPPGYEGKEHVKYKNPGFSKHHIRFPEDEPHMKSKVGKEEMHEMEDNFHMKTPKQTPHSLEAKIKRAMMKMDQPDQEDPDELQGNLVTNIGKKGEVDTTGDEQMGPNDMQGSGNGYKKKMAAAIARKKMNKG